MAQNKLKAYIVSDVHLNNNSYNKHSIKENPKREDFRKLLAELNLSFSPDDQIILILNGDIFDITGSWYNSILPWNDNKEKVEIILKDLVLEIIKNNQSIINELCQLLKYPFLKIVYVIGNHDGLIGEYPSAQELIKDKLLYEIPPELRIDKVSFVKSFEHADLGLYVEHGHRFDPFNTSNNNDEPPLGDVINILIVNRFVELTIDSLKNQGYSSELISSIKYRLYDVEYLRPLSLLPFWIDSIANIHYDSNESKSNLKSIKTVISEVIQELYKEPLVIKYLSKNLHLPRFFLKFIISLLVQFPPILPALSFIVSKLLRRTHSNSFQSEVAKTMHEEKGYQMIAFGHTHIPTVTALSTEGYYFNTGGWTPIINLFKYSENKLSHMEYLTAVIEFRKVERSGVLKIEKDLSIPNSKPQFSLETIQSGFD